MNVGFFTMRTNDRASAENVCKPPSLRKILGAAAAPFMPASGWDRSSGWSRRGPQGQGLRAAAPQVQFEPSLPNFCDAAKVCYHGEDKNVQQPLGF